MSFILGLTGPTGAGKGVFSACAKEYGFNVIDCDVLARQAVKKGMPALTALTEVFGKEILLKSGELNRQKLSALAFSSRDNTELLNKTVLPFIKKMVLKEIKGNYVLLDAPTLFESGIDSICDKTVGILAPLKTRKERIISRDGIDEISAERRIFAGKDDDFYKQKTDFIIYNDGNIENFIKEVKIYLENLIGGV